MRKNEWFDIVAVAGVSLHVWPFFGSTLLPFPPPFLLRLLLPRLSIVPSSSSRMNANMHWLLVVVRVLLQLKCHHRRCRQVLLLLQMLVLLGEVAWLISSNTADHYWVIDDMTAASQPEKRERESLLNE